MSQKSPTSAQAVLQSKISEKDFQSKITDYASFMGWVWVHQRPGLTQSGRWVTAISGKKGFPDLVLVRERVIFAEVKSEKGRLSKEQKEWQAKLSEAGAEVYVWRPSDWENISKKLR